MSEINTESCMASLDNRRHPMTPNVIEPAAIKDSLTVQEYEEVAGSKMEITTFPGKMAEQSAVVLSGAVRNYLIATVRETIDDDPEFAEEIEVLLGPLYAAPQPVSDVSVLAEGFVHFDEDGDDYDFHDIRSINGDCPDCIPALVIRKDSIVAGKPDLSGLVEALEWIVGANCDAGEGATDFAVAVGRGIAIGNIHRKAREALTDYRKQGGES